MSATKRRKKKRREPRLKVSLKEQLYQQTANLVERLQSGDLELPMDDVPEQVESIGEELNYCWRLTGAPRQQQVPRAAKAKNPVKKKPRTPEQIAQDKEEWELYLGLARLNEEEPDSNSDYERDDAECESPPEFDPDFDKPWPEPEQNPAGAPDPESVDPQTRLRELVARANLGDQAAHAEMRKMLDEHPQIWVTVGDLAAHAQHALIELVANGNALVADAMVRHAAELRKNLLTDPANQLERLTVQRVVATWLHVQYVDRASALADGGATNSATWARRQVMAEKRYLTALKSLKLVQQMRLPRKPEATTNVETPQAKEKRSGQPVAKEATRTPSHSAPAKSTSNGQCTPMPAQNGHARQDRQVIKPKANGRPVNRVLAAVRSTKREQEAV